MNIKGIFYYLASVIAFILGVAGIYFLTYNVWFQITVGTGGIITGAALFFYFVINLPSFQKAVSPILSSFSYFRKAELASIAYNIQGNINQFREVVNDESPNLIPEAEVEWITESEKESFFDDFKGKVIIRMHPSKDNDKNLVKAVMVQVSKGVIPESRMYVTQKTNTSIDLTLARKLLSKQNKRSALRYFINETFNKEIEDEEILSLIESMDAIDLRGFFTRVYLRELGELATRRGLRVQRLSDIREETNELLKFLEIIATRDVGERVPLTHEGKFLRTAIVMISEPGKFEREGVSPYVLSAFIEAQQGTDLIYLVARGRKIAFAHRVISYLEEHFKMELIEETDKIFTFELEDEKSEGICAVLRVNR